MNFRDILIKGLQVSITHEIDSMQLLSCVEFMLEEKTLLWLQRKRQSPQVQMRAVFVALILKFQSVILVERKNKYILTDNLVKNCERAWVDKIHLVFLLKIHRCIEMDLQDGKSSHELETASFCSHFNTNPRQEVDNQNQNIL